MNTLQKFTTQKKTQTCISEALLLLCCQMQTFDEDSNCGKKTSPDKLDESSLSSCVCLHEDNQ